MRGSILFHKLILKYKDLNISLCGGTEGEIVVAHDRLPSPAALLALVLGLRVYIFINWEGYRVRLYDTKEFKKKSDSRPNSHGMVKPVRL